MKTVNDECVCCGLPCLGESCPNRNVVRYTCDKCKEEFDNDELYVYDDEMLCEECLLLEFETVKQAEERGDYE